jgi:hypothetical protein
MKRLEKALFWFNVTQCTAWGLLIAPTLLIWRNSIPWLAFMSVWANFAAAIAAVGTSLIQRHARKQE